MFNPRVGKRRLVHLLIAASLIIALMSNQVWATKKERPSSGAMMIDVPVRVLSLGLTVFSSVIFIVALPFTLASGNIGDAWDVLVIEPLEFTFTRPLGQFDDWQSGNPPSDKEVLKE